MHLIKNIKSFFNDSSEYMRAEKQVTASFNSFMLRIMSVVYLVCLIAYYLSMCILQNIALQSILTTVAIFTQMAFAAFVNMYLGGKPRTSKTVTALCYLFDVLIMAFVSVLGVWVFPNESALAFPLMLICMSQIYTLPYVTTALGIIGCGIAFLSFSFAFKPFEIFKLDLLATVIAASISLTSLTVLMYLKTAEYKMRSRYKRLSAVDRMTGTLNKAEFENRFNSISAEKEYPPYALAILDLDRFKKINDEYGHSFGDKTLTVFCRRLEAALSLLPYKSELGRFGGDEFVIMFENIEDAQSLYLQLAQLVREVSRGITHELKTDIGFTVGIAVSTPSRENYKVMINLADDALLRAKKECKGSCLLYDGNIYNKNLQ